MKIVTTALIACGFHSGNPKLMYKTLRMAKQHGVSVGAHIGFPDLAGFGQRRILAAMEEVKADILYQLGALWAFCRVENMKLKYVKPHGGLYYLAVEDRNYARAIVDAIYEFDPNLVFFVLPNSFMEECALERGLRFSREIFADRAFTPEGKLVPRNIQGAVITDPEKVSERVLRMITEGRVECITGQDIEMSGETVCVHAHTPDATKIAAVLRSRLQSAGLEIKAIE